MNLMGWLYSKVEASLGSAGHTTLGVTLLIGEWILMSHVLSLLKACHRKYCGREGRTLESGIGHFGYSFT